jgi:adenylate cyclase
MSVGDPGGMSRPRRPLFYKYFVAVVVPLLVNGASEAWFGYRDQRDAELTSAC